MRGLNKDREALTHAAIDMLCALMHPMHEDYDLKQEQHNKSSLLGNEKFLNNLLDKWSSYAVSNILVTIITILCISHLKIASMFNTRVNQVLI